MNARAGSAPSGLAAPGAAGPAHGTSTYVDVAVVGAGVVGCMTAREVLHRSPGTSVMVLDRDTVGSGATRRSAGLHFPRGATEHVRRMTAYSQDWYEKLRAAQPDVPVHPLGMTVIADADAQAALHTAYLPAARLRPAPSPVAARRVTVPDGKAAWTADGCQYADVAALTAGLARAMRPYAAFREGVRVTAARPGPDDVTAPPRHGRRGHRRPGGPGPGPWLDDPAWAKALAPLGLRVKKIVALHVDIPTSTGDGAVVFHDEDAFLLPLHERGHWLFSYTCREWDVTPDGLSGGVSPQNLHEARELLAGYAPEFAARCASGRVFCDAYHPRGSGPVVTALDAAGRLVFAGAAGGSGYRLAPALAADAAGLLHLRDSAADETRDIK
ncbi:MULTISPECIES: FAD-dependent oxidoreductase [unclassified Streptomyces]|uniref:FAD-dependent oxidoreductase n=1 Tax=unclassified Streptomyces TaxID=2593676 RepID=UPI002E2F25F2|nr:MULTISPECIES: FAD-dependent oxidoreductase [unclassified Streptomyces]